MTERESTLQPLRVKSGILKNSCTHPGKAEGERRERKRGGGGSRGGERGGEERGGEETKSRGRGRRGEWGMITMYTHHSTASIASQSHKVCDMKTIIASGIIILTSAYVVRPTQNGSSLSPPPFSGM